MAKHGKHALIATINDLRERCAVHPVTHCWEWTGAQTGHYRMPSLHAYCHARGEKCVMTGPRAVWNIAFGEAPGPTELIFRACVNRLCLNPAHLRRAKNRAEIGLHLRRSGARKGNSVEARRANMRAAHQALGIKVTPPEVVRAIRAEGSGPTNMALQAKYGVAHNVISKIRRWQSHREVV